MSPLGDQSQFSDSLKHKFAGVSLRHKENTSLAAPGHSLQLCAAPTVKFKMAARGPQNGGLCLTRGLPLGYLALQTTFDDVFYQDTPSMRNIDYGGEEKNWEGGG